MDLSVEHFSPFVVPQMVLSGNAWIKWTRCRTLRGIASFGKALITSCGLLRRSRPGPDEKLENGQLIVSHRAPFFGGSVEMS